MSPEGPAAIAPVPVFVGTGNCTTLPPVVMRPISFAPLSVNQRLPSEPAAIPAGLPPKGSGNSVIAPDGVMRPILSAPLSVNQRLPSGPAVMMSGWLLETWQREFGDLAARGDTTDLVGGLLGGPGTLHRGRR